MNPPAILIQWSADRSAWVATAIETPEPVLVEGPSSSGAPSPGEALDRLLGLRFASLSDWDCPATLVDLTVYPEPTPAEIAAVAAPEGRC